MDGPIFTSLVAIIEDAGAAAFLYLVLVHPVVLLVYLYGKWRGRQEARLEHLEENARKAL